MNKERKNGILLVAIILAILSISAFAGTTDTLGMSGVKTKVQALLTDTALQWIIIIGLLAAAAFRWLKDHAYQALGLLVLMFFIVSLDSIATAIAGAMI